MPPGYNKLLLVVQLGGSTHFEVHDLSLSTSICKPLPFFLHDAWHDHYGGLMNGTIPTICLRHKCIALGPDNNTDNDIFVGKSKYIKYPRSQSRPSKNGAGFETFNNVTWTIFKGENFGMNIM